MFEKTLYGLEKNGGYKSWTIQVNDNTIMIIHGKDGGKMTTKTEVVKEGKQGRTPYEQAVSQAESRIKENRDKNYRETKEELVDLPILAMLAKDHTKVGKDEDILNGVYTSDKLDGIRMLAFCKIVDGAKTVKLQSRTGQPLSVPHIEKELLDVMIPGEVYDGEVYFHGPALQDINSAVQRTDTQGKIDECLAKVEKARYTKKYDEAKHVKASAELENAYLIHDLRKKLQYHVFDIVQLNVPFIRRLALLREIAYRFKKCSFVFEVEYRTAKSVDELTSQLNDCINRGYEGIMYRFPDGLYESGKRSSGLFKFKLFVDEEFLIVGASKDKQGYIIFELKNNINEEEFSCVMGDYNWRLSVADEDFTGQYMTIKFQSRNKGTLIPQFGTGKSLRKGEIVNGEFIPQE